MLDDMPLNALGILCGTDKSDLGYGYLRHYERALAGFRNLPINVIEIGVDDGASARMWQRWFSKALIIGVDIQQRCKAFEEERIRIEIGSQADGTFVDSLVAEYPPTVIVDDGSHQADHIIFTFERLFPALLPGGCYIIEDLFFHEGEGAAQTRGSAPMGAQDYILTFARQILDGHILPLHHTHLGHRLNNQIERIEAVGRAAFIWKQDVNPPDYEWLELLVERSGLAKNWDLLAGFILRNNGPLDMAERAARTAIRLNEGRWLYRSTLAFILEKAGKLAQAASCLEQTISQTPDPWRESLSARLKDIRARLAVSR